MYRTNDPRFRRRLNEIGQTLESANVTAQSGIYIFAQTYVKPCFDSVGNCLTSCVDAGCPSLNIRNRDRIRRQRGRARSQGRAELAFDFYDDWDEDEADGLLGWGTDEFDRLLAGNPGYGTVASAQPARQRGMSYPKARRKSVHDGVPEPPGIPGLGFFGKMFGARSLRYRPSAADLQEHPGARRLDRDVTEGEALLDESETSDADGEARRHKRARSNTVGSRETQDSYSSRGDIFPSDEEDDAVPLDDEFAMVLERRTTQSGNMSGPETESGSHKSGEGGQKRRSKRPSPGSRGSSRRTVSSRSTRSKGNSRTSSYAARAPSDILAPQLETDADEAHVPTLSELMQEDMMVAEEEETEVERKRREAYRKATEHKLPVQAPDTEPPPPSQESSAPSAMGSANDNEPTQLPSPLPTDDEQDDDPRHRDDAQASTDVDDASKA